MPTGELANEPGEAEVQGAATAPSAEGAPEPAAPEETAGAAGAEPAPALEQRADEPADVAASEAETDPASGDASEPALDSEQPVNDAADAAASGADTDPASGDASEPAPASDLASSEAEQPAASDPAADAPPPKPPGDEAEVADPDESAAATGESEEASAAAEDTQAEVDGTGAPHLKVVAAEPQEPAADEPPADGPPATRSRSRSKREPSERSRSRVREAPQPEQAANDFGIPEVKEAAARPDELDEVEAAAIEQVADDVPDTPFDKLVSRAKRISPERVRTILEALLFVTDKPLTEEAIRQCTGLELDIIRKQLRKLQGSYRDGVRGIVLHEVAGGWQFRTDPGTSEFVRRFLKVKPQRLTRAALETLAIVAYRQPVTRPEIEDIRAVDSGAVLKALLERRLIKIIGKKDEVGRPLLYGTTPEFLEFFNLRDLGSLPTLREFQELSEESRATVEKETGEAPPPTTENLVADLKDLEFEKRLAETNAEADAALAELEDALADTDQKARETAQVLNPPAPPSEEAPSGEAADTRPDGK
jgi:segregation and condensation protein B